MNRKFPIPVASLGPRDVEVVEKTTPFQGYFRLDRYHLRHRLFEGGWSDVMSREVFERGHAVGVLPYDPVRDAIILIEQFRIGAYIGAIEGRLGADESPWLLEIVAGIIEPGETAADVAVREAIEEAGCKVLDLAHACRYLASPGGTTESVEIMCAHVQAPAVGGIHGLAEEHEDIRVHVVPVAEAFAYLDAGRINNAMTLIAMLWFRVQHETLRQRWAGA